jgi:putative intracellular protease/amidase
VLVAANYVSVRLRYFDAEGLLTPAMTREAPASRFVAEAMNTPGVVVGALCHGLWMLTPTPELLAGRRMTCHQVVLADVHNAGAEYVSPTAADRAADFSGWTPDKDFPSVVVTDGNLVTGHSAKAVVPYIYAIARAIQNPVPASAPFTLPPPRAQSNKRILVVLSEHGYWGEELVGPMEVFDKRGYDVQFTTPNGRRARALPPSMDPNYLDPPLGRCVTTREMAEKVRRWDDLSPDRGELSRRLDNPIDLSEWIPERPYWSAPLMVRGLEAYHRRLDRLRKEIEDRFDALLIVGGSGPLVDLVNNQRVHDLILMFHDLDKPIGAECYGVACLAFARDVGSRESILRGKHVTGHCLEYDYKDGTGVLSPDSATQLESRFVPFNMGPPPYPLEYILRDATAPDGAFIGNFGKETSVIVDYPFITGRSTPDSYLTGEMMVRVLEDTNPPFRRFGW